MDFFSQTLYSVDLNFINKPCELLFFQALWTLIFSNTLDFYFLIPFGRLFNPVDLYFFKPSGLIIFSNYVDVYFFKPFELLFSLTLWTSLTLMDFNFLKLCGLLFSQTRWPFCSQTLCGLFPQTLRTFIF